MLNQIRGNLMLLESDRSGATAIEYAMIVLFIGLILLTLQTSIGTSVSNFFISMANGL